MGNLSGMPDQALTLASVSGLSSLIMSQMRSRQVPQPVPAPQASPTLSSQRAPIWITERTSFSRTRAQMQTYN
jgi:hypothetical protein